MARTRVLYAVGAAAAALALLIPYMMWLQQRGHENGNHPLTLFTMPVFFILALCAVLIATKALRWWGALVLGVLILIAHAVAVFTAGGLLFTLGQPLACMFGCSAEDAARYQAQNQMAGAIGFAAASFLAAGITLLPLTRFGPSARRSTAWRIALLAPPTAALIAAGLAWLSPQGVAGIVPLAWVYVFWQLALAAAIAGVLAAHTPLRRWFFWSKPDSEAPLPA